MTAKPRVALFIDCENASPAHVTDVLSHGRTLGKIVIARCYGGFAALKTWQAEIAKYHLMPIQTPPGAQKRNATDFSLTIDAVSLLHRDLFDHAVIVSSDADFTLLTLHIREHGKGVDGMGEEKATEGLRLAFDDFKTLKMTAGAAEDQTNGIDAPMSGRTANSSAHDGEAKIIRDTFAELVKNGPVTLLTLRSRIKADHPEMAIARTLLKKKVLAAGYKVDKDQRVTA